MMIGRCLSLRLPFFGCSVVFHLAALIKFFSVKVGGLKNVLEALKQSDTMEKHIYMSSIFALGPTNGDIADENQVHHEKNFCTGYEKSKVVADKIAVQAPSEGVSIVLLLSWGSLPAWQGHRRNRCCTGVGRTL
ncbi:hypothetical protein SESBI_44194 [Sesbania bispinosa]|nr:hypothetical protein SESBI_44194 [Sesbania bispinosa]